MRKMKADSLADLVTMAAKLLLRRRRKIDKRPRPPPLQLCNGSSLQDLSAVSLSGRRCQLFEVVRRNGCDCPRCRLRTSLREYGERTVIRHPHRPSPFSLPGFEDENCCRNMGGQVHPGIRRIAIWLAGDSRNSCRDTAEGESRFHIQSCPIAPVNGRRSEMLFAHLKRILRLDRLRLRGPFGARDEFLLAATAQNLRKLAKLILPPALKPA